MCLNISQSKRTISLINDWFVLRQWTYGEASLKANQKQDKYPIRAGSVPGEVVWARVTSARRHVTGINGGVGGGWPSLVIDGDGEEYCSKVIKSPGQAAS